MNTRQKILLVVLGITATYYIYDQFGAEGGGGISNIPVVKNLPVSILPIQNSQEQVKQAVLLSPGMGNLLVKFDRILVLDPFYTPDFIELLSRSSEGEFVEFDEMDSSMLLSGIVDDWAIIGGNIYELKNKVNGYILDEIGEKFVVLRMGNTKLRLELGGAKQDE